MHPLNRLGAAAFALAFLIGVPYALLWHAAWPDTFPSWDVALAHLRGWRLPPGVPAAVLITALWALWGMFALALAAEAVARLRGVPLRLRPFGPLQAIAATAVAATAVTPAAAFADTATQEDDGRQEERTPDREDGVPAAPSSAEQGPVERTRTVSGFAVGSAELTERMREDLAPTVEMLGDHWDEDVPVTITGHADPSGNADRNRELSRERAQAVADHLEEELGEDAPDTEVEGRGSDQPVEGPVESQRRVEIAYTLAPAPAPAPQQEADGEQTPQETGGAAAEEADRSLITVENAAAVDEDGPRVVVLEIPDGAVAGVVGFAGLAGGYLLGKRGSFVPRMALSLPRRLTGRPRRLALPPVPPRPEPGDEIDERVTVELDHVPGLGLTGKGADGAARRLIANALDPAEPLAVRILITEDEAVRLLGETGRDLLRDRPCEPVTLVPGTEDALAVLATELHAMAEEDRAPLALVISAPEARHEHALSGLLLHGQHRGVTAVILGSWPLGGNCTVDADGLISQTSQPLATLFHCSWPGSTAEEVHEAVHAHHAADHSVSERPVRSPRNREAAEQRPVLVAEDWDDDDAFVRVGDEAAWERLVRAWDEEAAESSGADAGPEPSADPEPVPDGGAAVDAAFRALREGEYADTAEDDSWWDETPASDTVSPQAGAEETPATREPDPVKTDGSAAAADEDTGTGEQAGAEPEPVPGEAGTPEPDAAPSLDGNTEAPATPTAIGDGTFDGAPAEADAPAGDSGDSTGEENAFAALNRDGGTPEPKADARAAAAGRPGPAPEPEQAGAPESARDAGPDTDGAGAAETVAPPQPSTPATPAPKEEQRTRVRHERAPGRKAGRVRVVRVDRPESPEHEGTEPAPTVVPAPAGPTSVPGARPAPAPSAAAARPRGKAAVRDRVQPRGAEPAPAAEEEASPAYRPQPAKPRKAGRGRTWKPRDDG
ncbi:OmpA family protein [Nocardiopsis sp. CC223A]|uniref:OmpA family protein n=1 Tax=Nocardiopsis sp. CC223A TaxID=3044051 RepID=UPI00278C7632|nr:OmpA family protein [Nocardiopsis sp. CC223A]